MFWRIGEYLWRLLNNPCFIISLKAGKADIEKGKVTNNFLVECTEICKSNDISEGCIYGMGSEYGIRLRFSENISDSSRQKIRNVWNIHK